jgi:hypothetical protein
LTSRGKTVASGALVLGGLFFLRQWGLLRTGPFGHDTGVVGSAFLFQLFMLGLSIAAAAYLAPVLRWGVLCVAGLLSLLVSHPAMALGAALLVPITLGVLALTPRVWLRGLILLAIALALAAAQRHDYIGWGTAFSMAFFYRVLVLAFAEPGTDAVALGRRVSLFYLVPPLAVFHPYLCYVPWLKEIDADGPSAGPAPWRRGLVHFGWALAYSGLLALLGRQAGWPVPRLLSFLTILFGVGQLVHVIHALLLLHGFECRVPIRWPLASTSYLEYWSRFQIHQKDLQVSLFYLPLMMRLRRINRFSAIAVALALTLIGWNTLLHVCSRYAFGAELSARTAWALEINCVNWAALTAALCIFELRRRRQAPPPHRAWLALGWLGTMALAIVTT